MIASERTSLVNACRIRAEEAMDVARSLVLGFVSEDGGTAEFSDFLTELGSSIDSLFTAFASAALQSLEPVSAVVEVGGVRYRRMADSRKRQDFVDLRGSLSAEGSLFRQVGIRNGPTVRPLQLRAGIVEGNCTARASEAITNAFQSLPRDEAMKSFKSNGTLPTLTGSTMYRVALGVGRQWEAYREEAETMRIESVELSDDAAAVSIAIDRVTVPMAEPRELTAKERTDPDSAPKNPIKVVGKQAYVGCLTIHDEWKRPLHSIRYAKMPGDNALPDLEAALRADLVSVLQRRSHLKVATLADGAVEMQGSLDRITADIEVDYRGTDFWHTVEYLSAAMTALGQPDGVVSEYRHCLMEEPDGGLCVLMDLLDRAYDLEHEASRPTLYVAAVDGVPTGYKDPRVKQDHSDALERLRKDTEAVVDDTLHVRSDVPRFSDHVPQELAVAIRYLWNHWERMDFARATDLGLPIGSGHVEASCKTIVSVRMKRTGARWKPDGAKAALDFRSLAVSDQWQAAIKFLLGTYQKRVVELTAA